MIHSEATTTRKIIACLLIYSHFLAGCVANSPNNGVVKTGPGPELSTDYESKQVENGTAAIAQMGPKLDVIVPVFDPGLDDKAENYEEEGIWPALDNTGAFGAVRVTPDSKATGDLYVIGKIEESDGEDVKIRINVVDISGREWMDKRFSHTVDEGFYKNYRRQGTDPYDPVFEEAAVEIVEELEDNSDTDLEELKQIAQLRFGASFNAEAFMEHMSTKGRYYEVVSLPSDNDPMLERVNAIRVRDQLFVDNLQQNYAGFSLSMEDSYLRWQEASFNEKQMREEAEMKGLFKAIGGVLLIGLSIAAATSRNNNGRVTIGDTVATTGAVAGGLAGAWMLSSSFQSFEEAKFHKESIDELGESVNMEMAPQVVAFEEETVELTGNVQEQYDQWRTFLHRMPHRRRHCNPTLTHA